MFSIFKKNNVNIWQVFANEMQAVFIPAKHDQCAKTEITYKNFVIVFDNFMNYGETGSRKMFFTRVFVKYESLDDFDFEICKVGFIRNIEKFFGAQDVEIGYPDFDKNFIVKTNNGFKIKNLLQNSEIRDILKQLTDVNLETTDKKGLWEEQLPKNKYNLCYFTEREITSTQELKLLLRLFQLMLDHLLITNSVSYIKLSC